MHHSSSHVGWGRFAVVAASALVSCFARPALADTTPATFTTTGSSVTTALLGDNTTIVTFLSSGTITLGDDAHVSRILVVGGGGGGGMGGGGGGAVVDVSEGLSVETGTPISVTVGAGGSAGSNMNAGGNGGTSSFGSVASALGGGGAGAFNATPKSGGANGGGGGTRNNADMSGGSPSWADGHKGGKGTNTGGSGTGCGGGGGGGGAGADGQDSGVAHTSTHNDETSESAGNGGDGLESDITGSVVCYGGGGGGGIRRTNFKYGGLGGAGGGGRGFGLTPGAAGGPSGSGKVMTNPQAATAGTDGLGGGGGGGGWDSAGSNFNPGKGGSGVVIVRIDPVAAGPEPVLSVEGVADAPESVLVTVRLAGVGDGASSAFVSYAVATSAAALDSATPVVAATGVEGNETVSFAIPNLTAGTTYYVRLFAENNLGETCRTEDVECLPYASLIPVTSVVGAARVFDVGLDRVAVFTNSADTTTFTLAARGGVELLLVGGGGGGGSYEAGGGGAGGFLHLENVVLDAGTYTVSVGAGGAPASASQAAGGNGGDTTLAKSGEAQNLYVAHGGGGGGGYNDRNGRSGGSGGGGGPQAGAGGESSALGAELGNPGGDNSSGNTSLYFSSGGGGAGEPGSHVDTVNILGGKGGDGLPCSITGEEVWYAGGGGAGQNDNSTLNGLVVPAGLGGRGGGGMGCRTADDVLDDYECGVDGLGGGGGGGRRPGKDAAGYSSRGAPGGSGTLIVRWRATADGTVRATVDSVAGSARGAVVAGSVRLAGATGVAIEMAVAPAGDPLGAWETLGTGLAAGERFTLALGGLAAGTVYDYAVRVTSGGTEGEILGAATGSFETLPGSPATLSGDPANATKTTVGTDTVYAFSEPGTYTFTVATRGYARWLLVGGGGAGGTSQGGGGGAGGFIERPSDTLEPGTYTVVVGAGGAISTSQQGSGGAGADSVLSLGGSVLCTAHGGGGGGYGGGVQVAGGAGGSSGGAGPCSAVVTPATAVSPELGNPGGAGSGSTESGHNTAAAGGGGAGGPGEDGHSSDIPTGVNRRQAGAGGPGVASDIAGETRYYAGGGGGGTYYDANGGYKGLGGSGVGGDGGGYTDEVCQNPVAPTAGAAGTGSGGGGGMRYSGCPDSARRGAAGGCGAFILRLAADAPAARPEVVLESLEAGAASAEAVLALRDAGSAATADLSLVYGPDPDELDLSAPVETGAAPGPYVATVAGLEPGRTWFFAPVASNAGGTVTGAVRSVTLPAAGALPAGEGPSGLWQVSRRVAAADFPAAFTNASLWAGSTVSNLVAGALAADTRSYVFEDPATGQTYVWQGPPAFYAYRGWIYLGGGKTVVFGSRYADSVYVVVDGRTLIHVCDSEKTDAFGSIETAEAGWHEIEVRVGHTTDRFGPDGDGKASWKSFGVAFNENGSTSPMPESGWTRLLDPGDGSLLRPDRPQVRTLSLTNAVASAGALSLAAVVGSGANAAHAYLVYGDADAGTASTNGWAHVTDLGAVAAANVASDLAAQVAGWGSAAKVARLVLATEGLFAWTEPVAFTATALPQVSDALVSDYSLGDRATFGATVAGGTAPYAATLLVGADTSSLAVAATTNLAGAGAFSFGAVEGFAPGYRNFYQVVVEDASGATARSEILSFVTPGASRVYDVTDTPDVEVWKTANPFENRQRTILFGGTLAELGAGDTTVLLLRNQGYYGFPGATTTVAHEGETLAVSAAGAYALPILLDWDLDVTWNWAASNATETASWGPTSLARTKEWGRNTTVVDATAYTWTGGKGLWTASSSWTPDGVWADIAGYPRRGSYAIFPANAAAVVSVPDTALTNRFSRLTLGTGADVTFRPAPGAAAPTLRLQEEAKVSSARTYAVSISSGAKLRFEGGIAASFVSAADTCFTPAGANTALEVADGARVTLGSSTGGYSYNAAGQTGTRLVVTNGATLVLNGYAFVEGTGSQMIVDDATVLQPLNGDSSRTALRTRNMNGAATLVLRGAHPVFQVGKTLYANQGNYSGAKEQYIDFVVPVGGWGDAPIRTDPSNTTTLGTGCGSGYAFYLRIPADSPAVLAGESLDVPLVRWPAGINATYVKLDRANLPHPDTDSFFTTTDAATGQKIYWAHIVGQADTTAPQASDFRIRALSQTGADLSFVVIPGAGGATSAAIEVLDANGDAVAGATVSPASFAATATFATNFLSVAGLDPATDYTLRVALDDGADPATADFAFRTIDDWAEGESSTADSVAQDGPYTVWTFTDTTPNAATFTVRRGGLAEILVVGGGGSGGSGVNTDTYGGGGGGGGQVIATNVVLVPGTYPIHIGKGAAKVWSRAVGSDGSSSAFADIVAAGGAGGGYNTAGRAGASGGGGSNGKAGGAGSTGFAGGAGVSNGAGGGGGGAGGAGSAGVSQTGGAGGAGVTNSISGHPAVYGAGGGGGGGGSYTSGRSFGGAGGDETAGVGASRNIDFRNAASVATMNGATGFGGGGGGGCASGESADYTPGSTYGGAGGSGTVIVRMRTITAAVPAPQAALKAGEAGEGDWTASLVVYTLGQGADHVDATLRVARDGGATSNLFAMGTVSATGAVVRVATGLAPSSDYEGVLVLDNGLEDGTLEIPVSFRTADPVATTVAAGAAWDYGAWTSAADFHASSIIAGKDPAVTIASTGASTVPANLFRATNGADDDLQLDMDRLYTWTWDDPVYLTSFRVFYKHSTTYYSAVNVASVEALGADGAWHAISPGPGHYVGTQFTRGYLLPADGAEVLWDQPAYGIRFTSDNYATTSGAHYLREVEAEGVPVADTPADLSISSLLRTDAGAKALVAFSHALPADATVTALVAPTHGGTDLAAWTAVASALAETGALSQNFSINAGDLSGMSYLRFRSDDGNGGVRWSETVFLPDVEILSSIPPVVHFVAVRGTTPATATIAASLLEAGSGAEGERANLYVRYAAASNAVEGATAHLVAANAPEGETAAVLDGLLPDRLYCAQLLAVNAGNDAGTSEIFSFQTAPDAFGGGAVSALTGWSCDAWTASSAETTNNLLRGLLATETPGAWTSAGDLAYLTDGRIDESEYYGPGPGTAIEFELGGVFSLSEFRVYQYSSDGARRTISIASLEWRDEAGAWHRISGSPLEFDSGASGNRAFLRPADGAPFLAVGATAFRFTQGDGGAHATHLIREMELLGEPAGAYRALTVDAASWSGGTLAATVSRSATNAVGTIHAVSGGAYHGTDAAAWAADGNDAVFGALAANEATASGSFTPAAGAAYVRFYEADGTGTVVAWSDTIPADPAVVRVVDGGVQADGDTAVFPIRVVSAGTGTLSVKVLLADDPDFTNATEIAVANPAVGDCTVATNVAPGATYWYRVVAETTGGGSDETPVASFTTRAGSVLDSAVSHTAYGHRFAVLRGSLTTFGAGVTTLEILLGDSPQTLAVWGTAVLERDGAFAIPVTATGMPGRVYYAFRTVNAAPGGTTWESRSGNGSFTTYDEVTYTWKTEVTDGAWNDPDNWTPNVSYYCTGYPDDSKASVVFPGGTAATVAVPGKYTFVTWNVVRNDFDVALVGDGPDVSGLTGNIEGGGSGGFRNFSLAFSGLAISEPNGITVGDTGSFNATLRFSDGTIASFGSTTALVGSNVWLVIESGASLSFGANGPNMGMKDGGIRLDGGTLSVPRILTDYGWGQTTNQAVLVSGDAPRIALSQAFRNNSGSNSDKQNADTDFVFSVPEKGWADPVICSETEGETFAGLLGDGAGKYTIAIDPASPFFRTSKEKTVTLVAWKGGIDVSHVTLVDPPKGATLFYTYGWPSTLTEPANTGDAPSGVRAHLRGFAGTFLLIK